VFFKKSGRAFQAEFRHNRTVAVASFIHLKALTDHAVQENHVINWSDASVIDRESDRSHLLLTVPRTGRRIDISLF